MQYSLFQTCMMDDRNTPCTLCNTHYFRPVWWTTGIDPVPYAVCTVSDLYDGRQEYTLYPMRCALFQTCMMDDRNTPCNPMRCALFQTHVMEGMYPVYMADWLRVWPREQIHIMRYEDYGDQEATRIGEIFDFLDLSPCYATLTLCSRRPRQPR